MIRSILAIVGLLLMVYGAVPLSVIVFDLSNGEVRPHPDQMKLWVSLYGGMLLFVVFGALTFVKRHKM